MNVPIKVILSLGLIFAIIQGVVFAGERFGNYESHCPGTAYCGDVGKTAYNRYGPKALRDVKLGTIVGVTFKKKGALIKVEAGVPEANIPERVHLSPRDAHYYIIDGSDGVGGPSFLRIAREIEAR